MRVSIGQDSHRFDFEDKVKPCVLGGVIFPGTPALSANSDGDVVLHAITNAISGITCRNILGAPADELCRAGITDSHAYLSLALADLAALHCRIEHLSLSLECRQPMISPRIADMRAHLGSCLQLAPGRIGITATTGEGLTDCGRGLGISVLCILTVSQEAAYEEEGVCQD